MQNGDLVNQSVSHCAFATSCAGEPRLVRYENPRRDRDVEKISEVERGAKTKAALKEKRE